MRQLTTVVAVAALLSACSSSSTPVTPSPATPTALSIASVNISGPTTLKRGNGAAYSAKAVLSDGTTAAGTVSPMWASSDAGVLAVGASGFTTGEGAGAARVRATIENVTGELAVTVLQNAAGLWLGTYRVTTCDQSGVFIQENWCRVGFSPGEQSYPIGLNAVQGLAEVVANVGLGSIIGELRGQLTPDSRLNLGGEFPFISEGFTFVFTVSAWETRFEAPDRMVEQFVLNIRREGQVGNVYVGATIVGLTRS